LARPAGLAARPKICRAVIVSPSVAQANSAENGGWARIASAMSETTPTGGEHGRRDRHVRRGPGERPDVEQPRRRARSGDDRRPPISAIAWCVSFPH
jgi:hypothetical protein